MLVTYDQRKDPKWSRSTAWRHLLANRPRFRAAGYVFAPHDCHFRKTHDLDPDTGLWVWQWYVWAFALPKGIFLDDEPSARPLDFVRPWGDHEVLERYRWEPQLDAYGHVSCSGFVLEDTPLLLAVKRGTTLVLGEGSKANRQYSM